MYKSFGPATDGNPELVVGGKQAPETFLVAIEGPASRNGSQEFPHFEGARFFAGFLFDEDQSMPLTRESSVAISLLDTLLLTEKSSHMCSGQKPEGPGARRAPNVIPLRGLLGRPSSVSSGAGSSGGPRSSRAPSGPSGLVSCSANAPGGVEIWSGAGPSCALALAEEPGG